MTEDRDRERDEIEQVIADLEEIAVDCEHDMRPFDANWTAWAADVARKASALLWRSRAVISPGGAAEKDTHAFKADVDYASCRVCGDWPNAPQHGKGAAEGRSRAVPPETRSCFLHGDYTSEDECPGCRAIGRPEPTLARRLRWMADAVIHAKTGARGRFFTTTRADEIAQLLLEAERHVQNETGEQNAEAIVAESRAVLPGDVVEVEMMRLMRPDVLGRYLSATEMWNLLLEFVRKNRTLAPDTEDGNR